MHRPKNIPRKRSGDKKGPLVCIACGGNQFGIIRESESGTDYVYFFECANEKCKHKEKIDHPEQFTIKCECGSEHGLLSDHIWRDE